MGAPLPFAPHTRKTPLNTERGLPHLVARKNRTELASLRLLLCAQFYKVLEAFDDKLRLRMLGFMPINRLLPLQCNLDSDRQPLTKPKRAYRHPIGIEHCHLIREGFGYEHIGRVWLPMIGFPQIAKMTSINREARNLSRPLFLGLCVPACINIDTHGTID